MGLSYATAYERIAELLGRVDGIGRAYNVMSVSADAWPIGLPEAAPGAAAAILNPPEDGEYIHTQAHHRRNYTVPVDLLYPIAIEGERLAEAYETLDNLVDLFAENVTLGSRVTVCLYQGDAAPRTFAWAGNEANYVGLRFTFRVSEGANITGAAGS